MKEKLEAIKGSIGKWEEIVNGTVCSELTRSVAEEEIMFLQFIYLAEGGKL